MKKVFLGLVMIVMVSGVCFAMASEPRNLPEPAATGTVPVNAVMKIVTGEVVSWMPISSRGRVIVRMDVLDNNKDITTIDLQLHTTKDWGTLQKNMMVEIPYFISDDGRNIAYWLTVESTGESSGSTEAK